MRQIGVIEAEGNLGQLLDIVDGGEEVAITRNGKVVARLVPPSPGFDREEARAAAQSIREMRKGVTLGGLKIRDLIAEGRE